MTKRNRGGYDDLLCFSRGLFCDTKNYNLLPFFFLVESRSRNSLAQALSASADRAIEAISVVGFGIFYLFPKASKGRKRDLVYALELQKKEGEPRRGVRRHKQSFLIVALGFGVKNANRLLEPTPPHPPTPGNKNRQGHPAQQ